MKYRHLTCNTENYQQLKKVTTNTGKPACFILNKLLNSLFSGKLYIQKEEGLIPLKPENL